MRAMQPNIVFLIWSRTRENGCGRCFCGTGKIKRKEGEGGKGRKDVSGPGSACPLTCDPRAVMDRDAGGPGSRTGKERGKRKKKKGTPPSLRYPFDGERRREEGGKKGGKKGKKNKFFFSGRDSFDFRNPVVITSHGKEGGHRKRKEEEKKVPAPACRGCPVLIICHRSCLITCTASPKDEEKEEKGEKKKEKRGGSRPRCVRFLWLAAEPTSVWCRPPPREKGRGRKKKKKRGPACGRDRTSELPPTEMRLMIRGLPPDSGDGSKGRGGEEGKGKKKKRKALPHRLHSP